jgi:hypothetical protein
MANLALPHHEAARIIDFERVILGGARSGRLPAAGPVCRLCGERQARFFVSGTIKTDHSHTLCFECYRLVVNRARALGLDTAGDIRPIASPLPDPARGQLNRPKLYAELTRRRHQAQIAARHAVEGLIAFVPDSTQGEGGQFELLAASY